MEVKEPATKYYPKMSPAEHLEWERKQHEYAEGKIIDMAGVAQRHNKILTNLILAVGNHLKGKDCYKFFNLNN